MLLMQTQEKEGEVGRNELALYRGNAPKHRHHPQRSRETDNVFARIEQPR